MYSENDEFKRMLKMMFGVYSPSDPIEIDAKVEEADGASGDSGAQSAPDAGTASGKGGASSSAKGASTGKTSGARDGAAGRTGRATGFPGSGGRPPINSFTERMAKWSRRALIGAAVVILLALGVAYWWFHPALNLHSPQVWTWILAAALVVILALQVAAARTPKRRGLFRKLTIIPAALFAMFVLGIVLGLPFFPGNAARYASVLETTDGDFSKDIQEVDYSEVPVIDRDSAALLGNRAMGSIPEYVSQFEISSAYSQINYRGRPVRVSPLVYADLFKWWSNRDEGVPGYVLVDMATQEAEVVTLDEGMKYTESEPLARNIDRYAQLRYPGYMFDQKSFELDEEGNPWWVFPVQARTIGLFEGTTIQRVVLVNACTGETEDYPIDECPTWVDRAYPTDLIIQQYNWSGAYKNGWLNSWLGQQGVVHTSAGAEGSLGYNYLAQDDDIYLYSGVTSATADNSIVGFILVNQRTGESHYYAVAGATEESAMASAEGQVQNLRYKATYPLLLNVAGQPTYFMALKDEAGLVKMFAMINVEQYQNVATGDTVAACQEEYLDMMASSGRLTGEEAGRASTGREVTGTISQVAQAVIDGNSHFYVTLEGDQSIYDFALPSMLDIVRYHAGDQISFSVEKSGADDDGAQVIEVTSFGKAKAASKEKEASDGGANAASDVAPAEGGSVSEESGAGK